MAARVAEPAVHKRLAVARALLGHDDSRLRDLEWAVRATATEPHTHTRYVLRTVPGIGEILRLILRYASHDIPRVPRVQDCGSYGRLGQCAKASAGKGDGTGGSKIGKASLTWACSEAAVLCVRDHP